jgi:hypothetical protein
LITNIHDSQTLGTSFTAYGTYNTSQIPATSGIRGRLENDDGSHPGAWQDAAIDRTGAWQINFTASPGSSLTLRIESNPLTTGCSATAVHLTIADGAGIGLTIDQIMSPFRKIDQDYAASGKINNSVVLSTSHTPEMPQSMISVIIFKGKEVSRKVAHKNSGGTWDITPQKHNLHAFGGKEVTSVIKVLVNGEAHPRTVSWPTEVKP